MSSDDDLRSLLITAEAVETLVVTPPPTVAQLQGRWRAKHRRRLAIASVVAAAVVAAWIALPRRNGVAPQQNAEIARNDESRAATEQTMRELARLDQEADLALATARRLQLARRIEDARGELLAQRPLSNDAEVATGHIDLAVMISVAHADRLGETLDDRGPAIELYRHVLDLFPDSRWSAVARQRIEAASVMN